MLVLNYERTGDRVIAKAEGTPEEIVKFMSLLSEQRNVDVRLVVDEKALVQAAVSASLDIIKSGRK